MAEIESKYLESIKQARNQELVWQKKAQEVEAAYVEQKKLSEADAANNAIVVNRLREQVASYSTRVSQRSSSSSCSDVEARTAKLAKRVLDLTEFGKRCSKRADELIIQVEGLQSFIEFKGIK